MLAWSIMRVLFFGLDWFGVWSYGGFGQVFGV